VFSSNLQHPIGFSSSILQHRRIDSFLSLHNAKPGRSSCLIQGLGGLINCFVDKASFD
jgi:hypothetical protein